MSKDKQNEPVVTENILFQGGRVVDPQMKYDGQMDVLIEDGVIKEVGKVDGGSFKGKVVDCSGKVIVPGLIDMHTHLREPGREDAETIASGCKAAMAGGFTAVCSMPNTNPVIDNRSQIEFINERASSTMVDVHPIGAVSVGLKGEQMTEMADMVEAGAVAFSDDGVPVADAALLRRALEYASMLGRPIIDHCEEKSLSENGVINESFVSTELGMKAIPPISEDIHVARDILVAEYNGCQLHIAHVSTKGAVRLIREAKARGVKVTAEACPHHIVLTDEAVRQFDTNTKMKPPLRTEEDRLAVIEGLKDGTIDVIATDHAPHSIETKDTEYDAAAFGILGLETAVGLILTHLVEKKEITFSQMVNMMAVRPRQILDLSENKIAKDSAANLTILDLDKKWTVDVEQFQSKSQNSPFHDWELKGKSAGIYIHSQLYWAD